MVGMSTPTLAVSVLSDVDGLTLGLISSVILIGIAWGEARVHIAGLREWKREAEVKIAAQAAQLAAMEVRESRTVARLDHLATQLQNIDLKLDRLLTRSSAA